MSASLGDPWIVEYLVNIAEEYGANISSVPRREKSAKAQLIKFLTFPPDTEPHVVWTEISDKKHHIRARLSADAIAKHNANPIHGGKPITFCKTAFVLIKDFRPALGRVARRDGQDGMTEEAFLFLDVDTVVLKGAFGDAVWESPVSATDDPGIREWQHGLRQDGGAGNVLKLRKQEAAARAAKIKEFEKQAAMESPAQPQPPVQTTINLAALDAKVRVARKPLAHKSKNSMPDNHNTDARVSPALSDDKAARRVTWKRFRAKMERHPRPPEDVFAQLLELCDTTSLKAANGTPDTTQLEQPQPRPDTPRATTPRLSPLPKSPSNWSPSIRGSPLHHSTDTEEEPGDSMEVDEVKPSADLLEIADRSTSSSVSQPMPILPILAGAETVSSGGASQRSSAPPSTSAVSGLSSDVAPHGSQLVPPPLPDPDPPRDQRGHRPLLDGFKVSLELESVPGGPPLLSWNDLHQILLRIGRARERKK